MKNLLKLLMLLAAAVIVQDAVAGNVCVIKGEIENVIPSVGDVGLGVASPQVIQGGCSCNYSQLWVDINSDGGKSIYSAILAAKIASKPIQVWIEDGQGQGSTSNDSVAYVYWSSCRVMSASVQ